MNELLGKKIGMTQIFGKDGQIVPVTVIGAGPCYMVLKREKEQNGYAAVQIGFEKMKKANKPLVGYFKKCGVEPLNYLHEVREEKPEVFSPGQEIKVDIFKCGDSVNVSGVSIGKGFAGTVKRWHFRRGPMAHGSKSHRIPGSTGAGTTPGNIKKGKKMSGRLGGEKVTVKNLKVVKIDSEHNLLFVSGAVPGPAGSLLIIRKN